MSGDVALNLSVSLTANDWAGKNAEYWVYVNSPANSMYNGQRFYYGFQNGQWGWTGVASPAIVQPLSDAPTQSVLSTSDLPSGVYNASFGVDTLINGTMDNEVFSIRSGSPSASPASRRWPSTARPPTLRSRQTGSAVAAYQGGAADVSNYPVLNMNAQYTGTYTFYFTMDNNQDGVADGTQVTASVRAIVR